MVSVQKLFGGEVNFGAHSKVKCSLESTLSSVNKEKEVLLPIGGGVNKEKEVLLLTNGSLSEWVMYGENGLPIKGLVRRGFQVGKPSPWPIFLSIAIVSFFLGFVSVLRGGFGGFNFSPELEVFFSYFTVGFGVLGMVGAIYGWARDVCYESLTGKHTTLEIRGIAIGMIWFLISEVVFFISLFWAWFHFSLSAMSMGFLWPPMGIWAPHPLGMPLLETWILLVSGKGVNWAKNCLLSGRLNEAMAGLAMSIFLGVIFICLQLWEYYWLPFAIWDGAFGSSFYLLTGFHGAHVLIGVVFLSVCLKRMVRRHFSMGHHFGLTAAIWYWHFVDAVWVVVYLFCIVWGWWGSC